MRPNLHYYNAQYAQPFCATSTLWKKSIFPWNNQHMPHSMSNCRRAFEGRVPCNPERQPAPGMLQPPSPTQPCPLRRRPSCRKIRTPPKPPRSVESHTCRGYCDQPEPSCSRGGYDYELRDRAIDCIRGRLEDMEPRLGCVGEKLQRVTDDMANFRDLLTTRRRDIEDLEGTVFEKIGETEERLNFHVRECTETKATVAADLGCLKHSVTDYMRQISERLDCRDEALDQFRGKISRQMEAIVKQVCARSSDVSELRYQVRRTMVVHLWVLFEQILTYTSAGKWQFSNAGVTQIILKK